ncbi:MAG: DUF2523 family protein [Rhodoferax sp.]|uniref:DUF2523 family protein n=1 Tax=Rhodoferax sp. TaxID=50421 RepID=UPI002722B910|nr:DUF2523 family protein [Rhodoferax sp.]MDO8447546.1 DUF2523 family protein [Rhodoferax sp.]
MGIGTWLGLMMAPLVARILIALGFSVVSIVGVTAVLGQLKSSFISQAMALPAAGLQLGLLAGLGVALGIIFGAVTTRVAMWQIANATKILGVTK